MGVTHSSMESAQSSPSFLLHRQSRGFQVSFGQKKDHAGLVHSFIDACKTNHPDTKAGMCLFLPSHCDNHRKQVHFLFDVAWSCEAGSVVQPVYFDLLKRIPRDPNDWIDPRNPHYDLMLSVVSSKARGCKHARSLSPLKNVLECELSVAGVRGHHQNGVRQSCPE